MGKERHWPAGLSIVQHIGIQLLLHILARPSTVFSIIYCAYYFLKLLLSTTIRQRWKVLCTKLQSSVHFLPGDLLGDICCKPICCLPKAQKASTNICRNRCDRYWKVVQIGAITITTTIAGCFVFCNLPCDKLHLWPSSVPPKMGGCSICFFFSLC